MNGHRRGKVETYVADQIDIFQNSQLCDTHQWSSRNEEIFETHSIFLCVQTYTHKWCIGLTFKSPS